MRICHVVASLAEQYGGPSKSVLALAKAATNAGAKVDLLTTGALEPAEATEGAFRRRAFRRTWPSRLACSRALADALATGEYDVVHHHALWQRPLHYSHEAAVKRRVPLVISPRGMMSDWAWGYRRGRKRLARHLVHPGALEGASGWHATSEAEAADILARGFRQPVCVAPNGVSAPEPSSVRAVQEFWRAAWPAIDHQRVALFYSRFHRKKRVLELIDLWLEHAPAEWVLLLVGLADDYTARELEQYIVRTSGAGRIRVYDGEGVPPPYAVSSLFLLPSHSENFGMSVAEAMAHGLPVLVTDATPWREVNALGAGWCVPWEDYPAALRDALGRTEAQLAQLGQSARAHVLQAYSWETSARRLMSFYVELRSARH